MKPLGRRVLCRPIETEDHYPGSVIVLPPETLKQEVRQQAEVIAVGDGEYDPDLEEYVPTDPRLVPGAWVLFQDWAKVYLDDGTFFLHERDITAILEIE